MGSCDQKQLPGKVLFERKPSSWEDKLRQINNRELQVIYNKRTHQLATEKQAKAKGKHLEELTVTMKVLDESNPAGQVTYFISGASYPKKALRYISTKENPNGLDLLKDAYHAGWWRTHAHVDKSQTNTNTMTWDLVPSP